jgi:hypothetical protein
MTGGLSSKRFLGMMASDRKQPPATVSQLAHVVLQTLDQCVEGDPAARTAERARSPHHDWRLVAALGQEPHTNLDEAVEASLVGLGCLAASATSEARVLA